MARNSLMGETYLERADYAKNAKGGTVKVYSKLFPSMKGIWQVCSKLHNRFCSWKAFLRRNENGFTRMGK